MFGSMLYHQDLFMRQECIIASAVFVAAIVASREFLKTAHGTFTGNNFKC